MRATTCEGPTRERMSSGKKLRHGVGVCKDCGAIRPVTVSPEHGIRTKGDPNCQCGNNRFRLID